MKQTFIVWKLAIARLFIYCFTVGASTYLGAMHSSKWSELSGEDRFDLCLGILISVAAIIISFLDNTVKNLASGNDLPPGVDSVVTSQSVTKTPNVETQTQTQQIKTHEIPSETNPKS